MPPHPLHETRLDGLRGYAAFIVTIYHCLLTFSFSGDNFAQPSIFEFAWNDASYAKIINRILIAFIGNGTAFVILFFVLSGYVITSSLHKKNITNFVQYFFYLLRRILRIYPTHLATLLIIIFLITSKNFTLPTNEIYSHWFNFWPRPFSTSELFKNIFLVTFPIYFFNGVTWSLYFEILGSLFLPIFFSMNKNLPWQLQFIFFITLIYCANPNISNHPTFSLKFIYCFYLGALIFFHRQFIQEKLRFLISKKILLLTIFLILPAARIFINSNFQYWITLTETLSAALLIVNCVGNKNQKFFLDGKFFTFLGKISYSFYIIQTPVIYLTFLSLSKIFSSDFLASYAFYLQLFTAIITLALTIIAAQILHILVEVPCMKFGKKISTSPKK